MRSLAKTFTRWLRRIGIAALLPLVACSQELPLPEGVDPRATPRIIVTKEIIEINGHPLRLRVSTVDVWSPWIDVLGPGNVYNAGWSRWWEARGLVLKVSNDGQVSHSDTFNIFLRRGRFFFWGTAATGMETGASLRTPFTGYLEINGVPVGPNMRLDELQRWRTKLGLPKLTPDGMTGYYRTGEDYKWAQHYYFDDDGVLSHIEFM